MLEEIHRELEKHFEETVKVRRYLHQHPELSFEEEETPKLIARLLTEMGIEVKTKVGGRGVIGTIYGGKPGKTVALRADFDALPIQDLKEVPYRSTVPGKMHACGHDAHTATLLSVANALQKKRESLQGKVVLIHQFAEELVPGGAKEMIKDGCLDDVDAIFGTHLWSTIPVGQAAFQPQAIMAAADHFEVEIIGKGGHGGLPHETVDPIVLGMNWVQLIQQIISRNVSPLDSAVISVGVFHGGDAFNIIPEKVTIKGTVRTFRSDVQQLIEQRMETLLHSLCEGAGASYQYQYIKGYPPVINHADETAFVRSCAEDILGSSNCYVAEPLMVGEDFSYYLQRVPGTFFLTGAGNPEKNAVYPHHHPMFDIDEQAMLYAGKILASAAWKFLNEKV
ncbi:M20 family metallopeptidase [Bacillus sp. PK3_68]|uniref:M20 metallopeptidase family protein n=1 Tax=Bacillus sp. PK3_68 TaxID=2027408 RepID=UPI000E739D37|nr:M20 family metallopeptidase [Bacillus sp. PK3_68]RJS58750.1 peptidase M20 [Bacillus sp. PK3_68]